MQQLNKKMQKRGCQIFLTPYNAHPLTGNKTTQSAMNTETAAREILKRKSKKLLDSHGGKRNIRLLAATTERLVFIKKSCSAL
ncbi:hypothetical protein AB6G26_01915 [Providencia hangzhouensis]|uniref:hypothetical protein n=1 Tax=Providencia hangzhouensis TaxID=3031799 RepID=UPI0034DD9EB5